VLRAIAFGLATGAGIQAFRNFPADGPVSMRSAALVLVVGVVFAFLGGLWGGRGRGPVTAVAVAQAEATATATNNVQVAVVLPGGRRAGEGVRVPDPASVTWIEGERRQVEASELDGIDLSELLGHEDYEGAG